jgi:RNA polymerase sigma-70 factor (ECF subfamily)
MAACVDRARQGDAAAARLLIERLYPLVERIVRAHQPRRVELEDVLQDVFMKVFARLDQYRGAVPVEHWVARLTLTTCLDHLRAQRRRPELRWADLTETEARVLEETLSEKEQAPPGYALDAREVIAKLLECLAAPDRLVISLLDLEQRTVAEIQQLTGWSRTAIKVRAFRARRKLRRMMEKLEEHRL